MENNTQTVNWANDLNEQAFADYKPYIKAIVFSFAGLGLAVVFRLFMFVMMYFGHYNLWAVHSIATLAVLAIATTSIFLAIRLYGVREIANNEALLKNQAKYSGLAIAGWYVLAMWDNFGGWMFGVATLVFFAVVALGVGIGWFIRYNSDKRKNESKPQQVNPYGEIGLGSTTHVMSSTPIEGGKNYKLKLALGTLPEDVVKAKGKLAQLFSTNPSNIVLTPDAKDFTVVDMDIYERNMLDVRIDWNGPTLPGTSIANPIEYGRYATGIRPQLFLAGKDGESSEHYIIAGMSGSGKSKTWQTIYSSVLNRSEVSVIYLDLIKGAQTVEPLASGIELFADNAEDCVSILEVMPRVIKARTDYLTTQGLSHWVSGCGINFLILHVEEAAQIPNSEIMVGLVETARSAGIMIVNSLQRPTNDRMATSARSNFGAAMCFGVKYEADAKFTIPDAVKSGANPHVFQNKAKGRHYLTGQDILAESENKAVQADWASNDVIRQAVEAGAAYRTPLDNVTASALGTVYTSYRNQVNRGTASWQRIRSTRASLQPAQINSEALTQVSKATHFTANSDEAKTNLWALLQTMEADGCHAFTASEIIEAFSERGKAWIYKTLKEWAEEGKLTKTETGYTIP
jgi:hypothetical protein